MFNIVAKVLVYENNLYWREDVLDDPEDDLALSTGTIHHQRCSVRILDISHFHLLWLMMPTFPDGLVDSVFNGIPDWVYEEEVLGTNYAHYVNE